MSSNDSDPPVAADDFPEFAEPPRHRPDHSDGGAADDVAEPASAEDTAQGEVDDVIARLRRERDEGTR